MVSAILDDNSYVISDNNRLKFANDIRLSLEKKALMIDYWNMDNAGGYGFKEYFTHHILTIDKDYHVTEEKESFVFNGNEMILRHHCFSSSDCSEEDNNANYVITPGNFVLISRKAPDKNSMSIALKKLLEKNKKDETLKWCEPPESNSVIQGNSVYDDCLIEFAQWNESFEPREPLEQDLEVINAANHIFERNYPTHVVYVAGNWVLFDIDIDYLDSVSPDLAIPWGKYCTLVHTQKGVVKKNDLKSLGLLFADLNLYDDPFNLNHHNLFLLISAVLDKNTDIIYSDRYVIMASDGVWDVLTNEMLLNIKRNEV